MALTLAQAKIVVARSLGGQNDPDELRGAGEAINAAVKRWNLENIWDFNQIEIGAPFTVASITSSGTGNKTLTTAIPHGFSGVYVGQTVTGNGNIVAGTKVASVTSDTVIVVDTNLTGAIAGVALTFSGGIPLVNGVQDYDLPYAFAKPMFCRLVVNERPLIFVRPRRYYQSIVAPAQDDVIPYAYTLFNIQGAPDSAGVLPLPTAKLRFFGIPGVVDTAVLNYYRRIQGFLNDVSVADEARVLDVPEDFEQAFLEFAIYYYLNNKDSESARTQDHKAQAHHELHKAILRDAGIPDDNVSFIPPDEWQSVRGLISNGGFYPWP